eukprot:TRINITY_DN5359_c0_g1_i1.p1 TRINITY_DN5359_c0_g1~~TRINITY_DN5359_c0_g1_i1.p1  ORF type:complete len:229 (+),score=65.39 TRINITY_DN5359_c0_g1_i1:240-926(+)
MFLLPSFLRKKMSLSAEHFGVLVSSAGACGGVVTGALLSESLGRKPSFMIGFFFAGVFMLLINLDVGDVALIVIAMVCRFFTGIYEAVWYTYTPEAFPTSARSFAFGTCSSMAKFSGLLAPIVCQLFSDRLGSAANTMVVSLAFFTGAVCAYHLPVETKGRPLTDYTSLSMLHEGGNQSTVAVGSLQGEPEDETKSLIHYDAVSYTHLRAHETVLDLVCRLLLEKKKK